eukprot:355908-Chlamydomonas_euryale.AAC.1
MVWQISQKAVPDKGQSALILRLEGVREVHCVCGPEPTPLHGLPTSPYLYSPGSIQRPFLPDCLWPTWRRQKQNLADEQLRVPGGSSCKHGRGNTSHGEGDAARQRGRATMANAFDFRAKNARSCPPPQHSLLFTLYSSHWIFWTQ